MDVQEEGEKPLTFATMSRLSFCDAASSARRRSASDCATPRSSSRRRTLGMGQGSQDTPHEP